MGQHRCRVTDVQPEILAIRVTVMPRDTNAHGTIFGGHILSLIDQAGAIAAHALGAEKLVTVAMREVEFKQPVHVGDLVSCWVRVVRVGRTSVTSIVRVVAQSPTAQARGEPERDVTQAEVVYVHIDDAGRPRAMPRP
ncbi:MAG: hotdog fold thioesterase [Deltaproteobacteria bacterium]|jgi:acyl-CoA thioesterase YciA|nr:hotdog fold thioesterase [Deltaproteobacteria bacterium]MBK8238243.1 hotdog fold thioesterase [Deltaproteobacteria bacterium]MBK8720339.1 hotdog fold thioesterase [Deltaproteobacteria bacterium]MBP7290598.1 hotdog fold thioesterase [Nannocystaceae bacterium]